MKRREFVALIGGSAITWPFFSYAQEPKPLPPKRVGAQTMSDSAPDKVLLIPDQWHIHNVGSLRDRRLFFVDGQLDFASGVTRDFVCTFIFDEDGHLVEHSIELLGDRGAYPWENSGRLISRHLAALGDRTLGEIWVRPFSVQSHGTVFGLIPRRVENGEWRVEFMPGNTLSFYPPWDAGGYDT